MQEESFPSILSNLTTNTTTISETLKKPALLAAPASLIHCDQPGKPKQVALLDPRLSKKSVAAMRKAAALALTSSLPTNAAVVTDATHVVGLQLSTSSSPTASSPTSPRSDISDHDPVFGTVNPQLQTDIDDYSMSILGGAFETVTKRRISKTVTGRGSKRHANLVADVSTFSPLAGSTSVVRSRMVVTSSLTAAGSVPGTNSLEIQPTTQVAAVAKVDVVVHPAISTSAVPGDPSQFHAVTQAGIANPNILAGFMFPDSSTRPHSMASSSSVHSSQSSGTLPSSGISVDAQVIYHVSLMNP